jgi:hypothetical protein
MLTVLLYDLTDYDSFAYLKQLPPTSSPLKFLVGNKSDRANEERAVETEEAQEWAQNRGYMHAEVSALNRKNIQMVFKIIQTKILKLLPLNTVR